MQKIGTDQPALFLGEAHVLDQGLFHFDGARLEGVEQIAMTPLEILEHFRKVHGHRLRIERQDPVDDMVCPGLVGGIEVAWLRRWFERTHHHTCWIGPEIEGLPVEKRGFRQGLLLSAWLVVFGASKRDSRTAFGFIAGLPTRYSSRISMSARSQETTDSAPRFSLARSGWSPSLQLPASTSTSGIERSLRPRNQLNARKASALHLGSGSARQAARHAEMVAVASRGC